MLPCSNPPRILRLLSNSMWVPILGRIFLHHHMLDMNHLLLLFTTIHFPSFFHKSAVRHVLRLAIVFSRKSAVRHVLRSAIVLSRETSETMM